MSGIKGQIQVQTAKPILSLSEAIKPGRKVEAFHLEPKLDGFRLVAHHGVQEDGDNWCRFYTRSRKYQDGKLPFLKEELERLTPPGTILDGELVCMRLDADGVCVNQFDHVQAVMNSLPDRAVALQEDYSDTPMEYYVFDILYEEGEYVGDEPLAFRRRRLTELLPPNISELVSVVQIYRATEKNHQKLLAQGFEGSMLKDRAKPYVQGKRGHGWFKQKWQPTVDVVITGFDPGVGKFAHLFGAVRFGQYNDKGILVERGACSGMDDATREWMHQNRDDLIGTVIEIAHMGLIAGGVGYRFRHPQFKRFRTDKEAKDCTWHNE